MLSTTQNNRAAIVNKKSIDPKESKISMVKESQIFFQFCSCPVRYQVGIFILNIDGHFGNNFSERSFETNQCFRTIKAIVSEDI